MIAATNQLDIGYTFSEEEMMKILGDCMDQRQIMSSTVQLLAEKIEKKEM